MSKTTDLRDAPTLRIPVVGVFDSGVGGLTIYRKVEENLPGCSYVYCSDNANFPYGPKSEAEVIACVREVCTRFIRNFSLDILIIACNTASTVALPVLRGEFRIPVIGVVPAIKPAAKRTLSGVIGLLATPGTIQRPYVQNLVKEFAPHCRVVSVGSSRLVQAAEAKAHGKPVDIELIRQEIQPLFSRSDQSDERLDTVVLGCTHFPLIADELVAAASWPVQWIDSGEAIAARTNVVLSEIGFSAFELERLKRREGEVARKAVVTKDNAESRLADPLFTSFGLEPRHLLGS